MNSLKTIVLELFGLFVDDGFFALAILLWIAAVRFLLPHLPHSPALDGPILFAGLALLLLATALRYARRSRN